MTDRVRDNDCSHCGLLARRYTETTVQPEGAMAVTLQAGWTHVIRPASLSSPDTMGG